jgi:hypothetical protein
MTDFQELLEKAARLPAFVGFETREQRKHRLEAKELLDFLNNLAKQGRFRVLIDEVTGNFIFRIDKRQRLIVTWLIVMDQKWIVIKKEVENLLQHDNSEEAGGIGDS